MNRKTIVLTHIPTISNIPINSIRKKKSPAKKLIQNIANGKMKIS